MKKNLLLLFFCFAYYPTLAQTEGGVTSNKAVHFGFKFGMNYSNMNFNKGYPPPIIPVEASWRPGFLLGFLLEVPLSYKLSLQQEYMYAQVNGEHRNLNAHYNHRYLTLPLLLKYRIMPKVILMGGSQFELLIAAKETINEQTINTTHHTEERSIGITGGLGYQAGRNISLNARFMHGFNHVGLSQRTDAQEFKYETFQITVDFNL